MLDRETIIRLVREAGFTSGKIAWHDEMLERFAALVAAAEREDIEDEYWSCLQADLENGVKCLNERAAADFRKNYPELSKFADWLRARGEQ